MRLSAPIIGVLVALLLAVAFYFLLFKPASEDQAAVEAETGIIVGIFDGATPVVARGAGRRNRLPRHADAKRSISRQRRSAQRT